MVVPASTELSGFKRDALVNTGPSAVKGCPIKTKHWVEIVLIDDVGRPVANQAYHLIALDGKEFAGYLDEEGAVRIENMEPGDCRVSFPDIEQTGPLRR